MQPTNARVYHTNILCTATVVVVERIEVVIVVLDTRVGRLETLATLATSKLDLESWRAEELKNWRAGKLDRELES